MSKIVVYRPFKAGRMALTHSKIVNIHRVSRYPNPLKRMRVSKPIQY